MIVCMWLNGCLHVTACVCMSVCEFRAGHDTSNELCQAPGGQPGAKWAELAENWHSSVIQSQIPPPRQHKATAVRCPDNHHDDIACWIYQLSIRGDDHDINRACVTRVPMSHLLSQHLYQGHTAICQDALYPNIFRNKIIECNIKICYQEKVYIQNI